MGQKNCTPLDTPSPSKQRFQSDFTIFRMPFTVGQTLVLKGYPSLDVNEFSLSLRPNNRDSALSIKPNFYNYNVELNTCTNGLSKHIDRLSRLPFSRGQEFTVKVEFKHQRFEVRLPDGFTREFYNHLGANEYAIVECSKGAFLTSVEISGDKPIFFP